MLRTDCPYRFKFCRIRTYFVFIVPLSQTRIVRGNWKHKEKRGLDGRRSSVIPEKMREIRIIRYFRCVCDCNGFFCSIYVILCVYIFSLRLFCYYFCLDLAYSHDLCTASQKQAKYLVRTPGLQARAHRLLNLFPSNVIIKCTANSLYPGNPGRLFVATRVRVPLGLAKEKIKLGIRRCDAGIAEEKQGNGGEECDR